MQLAQLEHREPLDQKAPQDRRVRLERAQLVLLDHKALRALRALQVQLEPLAHHLL